MVSRMVEKVLVVGTGLTGALSASFLREDLTKTAQISVWDKARGTGGRMSTSRSNTDGRCTVDLGAQYISATPGYQTKHAQYYKELLEAGILEPLQGTIEGHQDKEAGTQHYVTPTGVSSLVKYFLNKADPTLGKEQLVKEISVKNGGAVTVTTDSGVSVDFDAVVLTMPVPQILQLQGNIQNLINQKGIRKDLEDVSYSSRFAVGMFYPPGTSLNYPWSSSYITGNPCVRFVSIDNKKRGIENSEVGPSICVHTGAPWGLANVERDKEEAKHDILTHLKQVLPELPELPDPAEVKGHKWRYSQVHRGYQGSPGCVVLSQDPLLVLAGDAFVHSNFDGCVESALAVREVMKKEAETKNKL